MKKTKNDLHSSKLTKFSGENSMEKRVVVSCEMEITLKLIGGKYKPLILYYLIESGTTRFSELLNVSPSISQKTLSNQLRELSEDGLISRKVYAEVPPRVEYSITEKGLSLYPVLETMCEWGAQNVNEHFLVLHPQCTEE